MKKASRLYDALVVFLGQSQQWADVRHLYVLAWMVVGLISEGSVNLTRWIMSVQSRANLAQSTQRRFQRWLYNPRINVQRLYSPLIQGVLAQWKEEVLYLSLDTTTLWNQYCIIRLSVVHRGRAVPVGWRVIKHNSSSVAFHHYRDLLRRISRLMPEGVKVVLLADRGFVDTQLMNYLRQQLTWHYRIRVKSNFWLWQPRKGWTQVSNFHLGWGEALLLQNLRVCKTDPMTGAYLALGRECTKGERWFILSSETVTLQTFREYGMRFDIEENFLDDKAGGFELERSMIRCAPALSRLCLVLAIATVYLTLQGTAVVAQGKRRWVDPHWQRGNSYLRIGWNWVKTALARGWPLFKTFCLTGNCDPSPAIASRKQHQQRLYTLEFQVRSFDYAC